MELTHISVEPTNQIWKNMASSILAAVVLFSPWKLPALELCSETDELSSASPLENLLNHYGKTSKKT
ncbi:hypothetical protein LINPERHAP1_LOCUS38731 [Linum perenne]